MQGEVSQEALLARIEQLEERLQDYGGAANQNMEVFRAAFESVDKRMYTMMRILSEMYFKPGKIHLKTVREVIRDDETGETYIHAGRDIDWQMYFAEFDAMMALVNLAETHCMAPPEEPLPDNVIEFGGDQA